MASTRRQVRRLNDLSGKEWLVHSKSTVLNVRDRATLIEVNSAVDRGAMLSQAPPRDALKKQHPATFSEADVARLLRFFTREQALVLDPFIGSGSTAVACIAENRRCIGFELYEHWHQQSEARIDATLSQTYGRARPDVRCCDALTGLRDLEDESVDFVVTSPPYWSILNKQDHKARRERSSFGLPTDYGSHTQDLSSVTSYDEFLSALGEHLDQYHRVLRRTAYVAVIVSDFRHGKRYYMFHADVAARMERAGFTMQGLIVLIQDNKKLYPYGYPTAFVPNISNQYVVVARRLT